MFTSRMGPITAKLSTKNFSKIWASSRDENLKCYEDSRSYAFVLRWFCGKIFSKKLSPSKTTDSNIELNYKEKRLLPNFDSFFHNRSGPDWCFELLLPSNCCRWFSHQKKNRLVTLYSRWKLEMNPIAWRTDLFPNRSTLRKMRQDAIDGVLRKPQDCEPEVVVESGRQSCVARGRRDRGDGVLLGRSASIITLRFIFLKPDCWMDWRWYSMKDWKKIEIKFYLFSEVLS